MPQGLPLWKPPYSRMTAIDMNRGEHVWMTPLGDGDRIRNLPLLRDLNLPPLGGEGRGGPVLTKTLLFMGQGARRSRGGAGATKPLLRAFDKATGEVIHAFELPAAPGGTPMTYMVDGKQYIVVAVGWDDMPSEWVALALP